MAIKKLVAACLLGVTVAAVATTPASAGGAAVAVALGLASFAVFNQLAFGLFAAPFWGAPYYYPAYYPPPAYYSPYPYYSAPAVVSYPAAAPPYYASTAYASTATVSYAAAPAYAAPPPAVRSTAVPRREVVYPHGRYVLRGDGITSPYQWVWLANPPAVAVAGVAVR